MLLDEDTCYRALKSRDARFDGRFFTAVLTTGIYCRPVCPARTPKRENVRFFELAAAAEEAGFRACRRCRPETAPGTPTWNGTSSTVSRALRMIEDGFLDEQSAPELASRLGIGERQLRRLFVEHVGVAPAAVARTRRVHFARVMVEATSLPVSELAYAAGFQSLRQFNDVFRRAFGRTPTELRRARGVVALADRRIEGEKALRLRLAYRPPFDWDAMLAFLGARAIPGVEAVAEGRYARTFAQGDARGWLVVAPAPKGHALELSVHGAPSRGLLTLVRKVRRLFDLDAEPTAIAQVLSADPLLGELIARRPGLRVPSAFDPFEGAVRVVVGQQISVAGARTLLGRLAERHGEEIEAPLGLRRVFPVAGALAKARIEGMPAARAATIAELAKAAAKDRLELAALISGQATIRGVGPWTTELLRMRVVGDPDAFPAGDLALERMLGAGELAARSEAWRPWRAYAAMQLWAEDAERERSRRETTRRVAR